METKRNTIYTMTTPEGVKLEFEIGGYAERATAFIVDLLMIMLLIIVTWLALWSLNLLERASTTLAVGILASFCFREGYFIFCELRYSGTTPGKRSQGLRVVARDGGPVTGEMIIARNFMRDVEFFIPIIIMMAPESIFGEVEGFAHLLAIGWAMLFLLLPLLNRYRLRIGDIVAGTMVVCEPKGVLLPDIATSAPAQSLAQGTNETAGYAFLPEQLEYYGIKELQVLEDLFRRHREGRADKEILFEVCERICKKIGWRKPPERRDMISFLHNFYTAQRAHLEQRILFGKRKEHKADTSKSSR